MSSIVVVVYDVPRPPLTAHHLVTDWKPDEPIGPLPTQPETNTHFIGRFNQPVVNIAALRQLWNAPNLDFTLPVQSETNTHFLGKFVPQGTNTAALLASLLYNYQGSDNSGPFANQQETNTNFIGQFVPQGTNRSALFASLLYNYQGSDNSGPQPTQAETNTNFLATYQPGTLAVPIFLRQIPSSFDSAPTKETPNHFIGRFTPVKYQRFAYNFAGSNLSTATAQFETSTHFLAKFSPVQYRRYPYNFTGSNLSILAAQVAPAMSVIGRFTPVTYVRFAFNHAGSDQTGVTFGAFSFGYIVD